MFYIAVFVLAGFVLAVFVLAVFVLDIFVFAVFVLAVFVQHDGGATRQEPGRKAMAGPRGNSKATRQR